MTLRDRFVAGKLGTKWGVWLSAPGKNVLTAGVDDLLISPAGDRTNVQFLAKGVRYVKAYNGLTSGSFADVFFEPLSNPPLVWTQTVVSNVNVIPAMQSGMSVGLESGRPSRYHIDSYVDHFRAQNDKPIAYYVLYMIFMQPVDVRDGAA